MCGIAGHFVKNTLDAERLDACRGLMRRRGPDDEGFVTRKTGDGTHLYLLHARLSIIDPDSRARQPFTNGGDALCYNGEVYNSLELRRRLAASGALSQTEICTEVLAKVQI